VSIKHMQIGYKNGVYLRNFRDIGIIEECYSHC